MLARAGKRVSNHSFMPLTIEYVTHASLKIKTPEVTFLCDPFFFLDPLLKSFMCHYPPRKLTAAILGDLDYVYCSHIHDDHSHVPTLKQIKGRIKTMVLPAGKPDLEQKIRDAGFEDIVFLENEKTVRVHPDLAFTCYHDKNGFDTALVIETPDAVVLHQNDCRLDEATFGRMAARFHIDYAFFPHTSFQDLYPMLLTRPKEELLKLSNAREEKEIDYLIESIAILKPKVVIPYSFTIVYFNDDQLEQNGFGRTTPPMFQQKLAQADPDQTCWVMEPGDVIEVDTNKVSKANKDDAWGASLDDYMANIERHTQADRKAYPKPNFMEPDMAVLMFERFFEKRKLKPFAEDLAGQTIAFHVEGNKKKKTFYLDTGKATLSQEETIYPFLEITLPASVLIELLKGQYDPFMILYSYRVRFKPNIHLGFEPRAECVFYTLTIINIFNPELHEELMGYLLKNGTPEGAIF